MSGVESQPFRAGLKFSGQPFRPRSDSRSIFEFPHTRSVQFTPGLTSWGTLSRPYGTGLGGNVHPGLTSWATLSRPYGTGLGGNVHPGLTSWATLSRPYGTGLG